MCTTFLTKECDCSQWTVVKQNGVDHSKTQCSHVVNATSLGVEIDLNRQNAHCQWVLEIRELERCDYQKFSLRLSKILFFSVSFSEIWIICMI